MHMQVTDVPARLRGRLGGSGSLIGAALKGIVHDGEKEKQHQAHERVERREQQQEAVGRRETFSRGRRVVEQVEEEAPARRDVREVREVKESRRGGRSRR